VVAFSEPRCDFSVTRGWQQIMNAVRWIKQFAEKNNGKVCRAYNYSCSYTVQVCIMGPVARLMLSVKMDTTNVHRVRTLMMLAGGLSTPVLPLLCLRCDVKCVAVSRINAGDCAAGNRVYKSFHQSAEGGRYLLVADCDG